MNFYKIINTVVFATSLLFINTANAGLIVSDNSQFVYDDITNVTWYTDTNNAAMNWSDSQQWALDLSITTSGNNYSDWFLPERRGTNLLEVLLNTSLSEYQSAFNISDASSRFWTSSTALANENRAFYFTGEQLRATAVKSQEYFAWALHSGKVGNYTALAEVPEPTTLALFGLALIGLMVRRHTSKF